MCGIKWVSLIYLSVCCVCLVSAIPFFDKPLPDNCEWKKHQKGAVLCTEEIPDFALYDLGQLSDIKSLEIADCGSSILANNSFASLTSLADLTIDCHLISVEAGTFANLTKLRYVSLQKEAGLLPEGLFCGLPSLRTLELTHNSLTINTNLGVSSKCAPTPNDTCAATVTELNVAFNAITDLTEQLLCNLPNLEVLNVSNNLVSTIRPGALTNATVLKKLYLANNSLTTLAADTFAKAGRLVDLDLSFNQLTTISAAVFRNLTKLTHLNLRGNRIESISQSAFIDLGTLTRLDLRNNLLAKLDSVFFPLLKLHSLHLSGNQLGYVTSKNFNTLYKLTDVDLDANNLVSIDKGTFKNNPRLITLSIKNNRLTSLPDFTYNRLLFSLHAANNSISNLGEGAFANCTFLLNLNLAQNLLGSIDNTTFGILPHLLKLDLSSNRIATIKNNSFDGLLSLKFLDLDNNRLTLAENTYQTLEVVDNMDLFLSLDSLAFLNLSSNTISHFSYSWFPLHLAYVGLANNSISTLPTYNLLLNPTPFLHTLDLSNNHIATIATSQFPPSLTNIILTENKIESVNKNAFIDLKNLDYLFLSRNNLMTLPQLNTGSPLTTMTLSSNPWLCDCKLAWLTKTKMLPFIVHDAILMKCKFLFNKAYPDGSLLLSGDEDDFLCTFKQDGESDGKCTSTSPAKACLYHCPAGCTCYHDITWRIVKLDCSNARLTTVPEAIPNITDTFYLDGNEIPSLYQTSLINAIAVKDLYLNASKIIKIENGTFSMTLDLETLHLDHNLLETLPVQIFKNLTKLKALDLSFNQLKALKEEIFAPLKSLKTLKLQNNMLTDFPVWSLGTLPTVNAISLYGNPWSCNCDYAAKYREWLQNHLEKVQSVSKLVCSLNSMKNISLAIFDATHCYHAATVSSRTVYVHSGTSTALTAVAVTIGIMALVLGALAFVYRNHISLAIERKFGRRLL